MLQCYMILLETCHILRQVYFLNNNKHVTLVHQRHLCFWIMYKKYIKNRKIIWKNISSKEMCLLVLFLAWYPLHPEWKLDEAPLNQQLTGLLEKENLFLRQASKIGRCTRCTLFPVGAVNYYKSLKNLHEITGIRDADNRILTG